MATENEQLIQQIDELRNALQGLNTVVKDDTGFFKSLGQELGVTSKSLKQTQAELGQHLGATLKDAGRGLASFAIAVGKGDTSFNSLGGVVDVATNALAGLAKAIPLVGGVVGELVKAAGEGAKFVLAEMQVVADAFKDIGTVGALTADGMSGLVRQFTASKMTMEGYKKVVMENGAALARFGGIAGEGAERFSKAVGELANSDLRKLGYSADQIGQTTAGFLKQQVLLGKQNQLTQDTLRSGSYAYARELDELAKLTGANKDELQKKQQDALRESRFLASQLKLEDQGRNDQAKAIRKYTSIIGNESPQFSKGLRDLATSFADSAEAGMVINATNGEAQHIQDLLNEGKIDEIKAVAMLQESLKRNRSALIEQSATTEDSNNAFGGLAEKVAIMGLQFDDEGNVRKKLTETTDAQIKKTDALTNQVIGAQQALEAFHRQMFNIAVSLMPKAADAVQAFTTMMSQAVSAIVDAIGELNGGGRGGGKGPSNLRKGLQLVGGGIGAAAGIFGTSVLAGATGGGGLLASTALIGGGTALGVTAGNKIADYFGADKGGLETEFGFGGGGGSRPEDLLVFGTGSGDRQHFDQLEPSLRQRVLAAAQEYYQTSGGKKLKINSGFRSFEEQANVDSGGRPKAAPGQSDHNRGMAVDIQNHRDPLAVQALNNQGLSQKVAGDLPHFSMAYGGLVSGPKSGYQGMLHGDEAVIPLTGGRSVPVEMPAFTGSLQEQIGLLADNNNLLSELISLMSSNNSISSKILQVARN